MWRPDYCTTEQLANFLRIPDGDEVDTDELATAITAASTAINRCTHRQFGNVDTSQTRTYEAGWSRTGSCWVIRTMDDLAASTGLTVTIGGVAVTDWTLGPANAVLDGKVFTRLTLGPAAEAYPSGSNLVDMASDQWGWTTIPTTVLQAAKLQAGRFHKRRDALFGVAGSPADGSEVRLLDRVDPDVAVMLTDYKRRWYAK